MTDDEALGRRAKDVLHAYRATRTPDAERQQAALAAIEARIAGIDPGGPPSGDPAHGTGNGSRSEVSSVGSNHAALAKWSLVGIVALGAGVGLYWSSSTSNQNAPISIAPPTETRDQQPSQFEQPQPPSTADTVPHAEPASTATEERAEPEPPRPHPALEPQRPSTSPRMTRGGDVRETPASTLAEEMRLLAAGQQAFNDGSFASALRQFEEHRARFPSGVLVRERELKRIQTLCRLGRIAEARAAAKRFAKAHAGSPNAERALGICGGDSDEQP